MEVKKLLKSGLGDAAAAADGWGDAVGCRGSAGRGVGGLGLRMMMPPGYMRINTGKKQHELQDNVCCSL